MAEGSQEAAMMTTPGTPRKRPLKWLILLGIVAGGFYYGPNLIKGGNPSEAPSGQALPIPVASVISRPVVRWSEFSGRIEAMKTAEIRPRVSGQITAIHFKDGAEVKKGDPLFTIDPRPFEAAYISAKGAHAQTEAALARASKLIKSKAISQAEYEAAQSANQQALGNYKLAQANLDYAHIAAPISGKISRAELTVGNMVEVGPATPLLASIVDLTPIYASFELDEQTYLRTIQGKPASLLKKIPVEVLLGDGATAPIAAVVHAFDNQIAAGSGTLRVRALLENKDQTIVPGLFAKVRLGTPEAEPSILIHPSAYATDLNKKFVLVVDAENTTQYREVTVGAVNDGLQIITSGLAEGERIVVGRIQMLRPGMKLQPIDTDMTSLKPLNGDTPESAAGTPPQDAGK